MQHGLFHFFVATGNFNALYVCTIYAFSNAGKRVYTKKQSLIIYHSDLIGMFKNQESKIRILLFYISVTSKGSLGRVMYIAHTGEL